MQAFSNLSLTTRRALCAAMVFATIANADTVVMNDGEELDSWCVILNGQVEVVRNGTVEQLGLGDRCVCLMFVLIDKAEDCSHVLIGSKRMYSKNYFKETIIMQVST